MMIQNIKSDVNFPKRWLRVTSYVLNAYAL